MDQQIATKKKVSFKLENDNGSEIDSEPKSNDERLTKKILPKPKLQVPSFCFQRLIKSTTTNNSNAPLTIKEKHSLDLSKLTMGELNDLLDKQVKMLQNKTLLSKLKDKGLRIKAFHDKIANTIKDKELKEAESMLNKMSIDPEKNNSYSKPIDIVKNCSDISEVTLNNRFNLPKNINTDQSPENSEMQTRLKITNKPKEIKTLDWDDSLKTLEIVSHKERDVLKDQILRLYDDRINGNGDFGLDFSGVSSDELDSDDDVIVNVNCV